MFNGRVTKGRIVLAFGTLISTTSLSANDSVTFTISGYMPARCEIESVSRFLSDNRITLIANRYCNVPHRFTVDFGAVRALRQGRYRQLRSTAEPTLVSGPSSPMIAR